MEKYVSYEIREIDESGDVVDITECFEGKGAKLKAIKAFRGYELWHDEAVAAVLERAEHWGDDDEGVQKRKYQTMLVFGDLEALIEGGWMAEGAGDA